MQDNYKLHIVFHFNNISLFRFFCLPQHIALCDIDALIYTQTHSHKSCSKPVKDMGNCDTVTAANVC